MNSVERTLITVLFATVIANTPASGQAVGANVGGVVTDETGAHVPGVTVTITNKANGRTQVLVTGSEGNYRAVALQPAPYQIKAELSGFASQAREITLTVGADATVDFKLGVAALQETVTVSGDAPLIEVAKSQPSAVVVAEQVAQLPVLERNFLTLAQLLPGSGPDNSSSQRFANTKFGGVADQRNGFTTIIDGGSVDDAIWGSPTINLTQDAVQEFKVFRHQFDAQYGGALTAVVSVVTKSGTNRYSGTGFYFGRDRELNARNAFAQEKPPFSQQRYGGSFGGPVALNRGHFFGTFEYNNVNKVKILALPPTNPFAIRENGIYPAGAREYLGAAKFDYRFNDAHSLLARYAHDNNRARRTGNATSDSNEIDDENRAKSLIGEETWIVSQRTVNAFRIHVLKHFLGTVPHSDDLGIVRPSVTTGRNQVNPQFFPRTLLTVFDTLYINTPGHDFKFGGEVTFGDHDFEAHFFEKGVFTFTTDAAFDANDPRTYPISFVQQKPGLFNYRSKEIALFAQDDWRVASRVRLNLGVRYFVDTNFRMNSFYAALLDNPSFAGLDRFRSRDAGTALNNLQPRLGLTWDARGNGTLVVRSGWGMYVTRNRPWFQLRTQNQLSGSAVRIEDPQFLRFYPDITNVLGGKSLDQFVASGGPRLIGTVIPDDSKLPYAFNTTAGVQWQINPATSLDLDFVNSLGRNQLGFTDRNLPPSGPISPTNPRPFRQFSQVLVLENFTKSWYDALEAQLRTRVRAGSSLQVSYTLSRSYLDGVDFFNNRRGTERTAQEQGYNPTDQRHNLTFAGSTTLPGRIQISGIVKLISGSPMKVQAGFDMDGDGSVQGDRPVGLPITVGRADAEPSVAIINALRASRNLSGIERTLLDLDPFVTVDLRVTKEVALGAQRRLDLFVEGFNLTNHVNFEPYTVNPNIISRDFLIRRSARDARQIQWGVRYVF